MSIFSKIKVRKPKRTVHNLSYSSQFSLPFGRLVPIMCEKVVPGDKFVHSHEFLMRFAPFVGQVFQSFQVRTEYFFVPSRLLWDNFEKFLVEDDATVYPHPQFALSQLLDGEHDMTCSLVDYFNLPTVSYQVVDGELVTSPLDGSNVGNGYIDCLPFAAYLKIFFDYYADENLMMAGDMDYQNLCDSFDTYVKSANGSSYGTTLKTFFDAINGETSETPTPDVSFAPFMRAYPKDYFTSALPWAQRGPLVQIPMNGSGDVVVHANLSGGRVNYEGVGAYFEAGPTAGDVNVKLFPYGSLSVGTNNSSSTITMVDGEDLGNRKPIWTLGPDSVSSSDVISAIQNSRPIQFKAVNVNGTATINDLRTAIAVQNWLEKNARAGVRYKEQLMSHFGVRSRDYRLDRAELLQSTKSTVSIGEVFTTAQNDSETFIPGLGISTATGSSAVKPFKHYFEEHGYVIGLMSVYPKPSYCQGVPRQFMELDKFDYYWPEFQNIGEQDIYNGELYVNDHVDMKGTFGYTPRYAHYKNRPNQVHGDFRTSLNFMHDGRLFGSAPMLNQSFINIDVSKNDLNRVFNVKGQYSNANPIYVDMFHNFKAIRPMDYFGTPRIL